MDIGLAVGMLGTFFILLAFVLNVLQKLRSTSITYLGLNFYGGALLVLYALTLNSVPFVILNIVWMCAAMYEYWHIHKKKTRKHRY